MTQITRTRLSRVALSGALFLAAVPLFAQDLYWTDSQKRIHAADINGENAVVIFDGNTSSPPMASHAVDIAVTDTHIYWSGHDGGDIWRANRDGSNATQFIPNAGNSIQFLTANENSGFLYYSDWTGGIFQADLATGGNITNIHSGSEGQYTGVAIETITSADEILWLSAATSELMRTAWGSSWSDAKLPGGTATYGLAMNPEIRMSYYTNFSEGTLRQYHHSQGTHQLLQTGLIQPLGIKISPSGSHVLIVERGRGISVYEPSTGRSMLLVESADAHFGLAVAADPEPLPAPPPPEPGELLFVENFELYEVGGYPATVANGGVWASTSTISEGSAEVVEDVDNLFGFGESNKYLRVRNARNINLIAPIPPTKVATASFDIIGRFEGNDGNRWLNMELRSGGGRVGTASIRFTNATIRTHPADHEAWPTPQGFTGPLNPSYGGNEIPLQLHLIANNSDEEITYAGPDGVDYPLSGNHSTIWVFNYSTGYWTHVLPEFDFERSGPTNTDIDDLRILLDTGGTSQIVRSFDLDNIRVLQGAVIDGPEGKEVTYPEEAVLVIHDDFDHTEPTASGTDRIPLEEYNGPLTLAYHSSAAGEIRIVEDTDNLFGRGTDNRVLYFKDANGLRLNAFDIMDSGVATLSFDLFHPGTFSEAGTNRLTANFWSGGGGADLVVSFGLEERNRAKGTYAVRGMEHRQISGGYIQRYTIIANNMNEEISYDSPGGPRNLGPGESVIWLNGYQYAEPYSFDRTASTGIPIDSFQINTLSSGAWEGYLDNVRIWEGAIVPDPDVAGRSTEPPLVPLIAYDGFDYNAGPVAGQDGGNGWLDGFLTADSRSDAEITSPGFEFTNIPSIGNKLLAANGARSLRVLTDC